MIAGFLFFRPAPKYAPVRIKKVSDPVSGFKEAIYSPNYV